MRSPRALLCAFFVVIATCAAAEPVIPVSELKVGMKGYGLTVFEGDRIDRFEVELLGVLKNILPKHDLVLIRCSASPVLERANIIAGMSGSPIYFDGRLAGALSRAFGFAKEPLALFTPIQDMLDEGSRPLEYGKYWKAGARSRIRPCLTPLVASGFTPRALDLLEKGLGPFGLTPMEGGGSSGQGGPADLVAGSAVGFQLMRGDWELTGVGTVTCVDGDKVFAFGHPFLQGGELGMPMVTAVVHAVVSSSEVSFKLASAGKEIGALVRDQSSCVMGVRGKKCAMVPVSVTLRHVRGGREDHFAVEVIQNAAYTGMLIRAGVMSAVEALEPSSNDCTVDLKLKIDVENHGTIELSDQLSSPSGPLGDGMGVFRVFGVLEQILDNPFEKVRLKSVAVELAMRPERRDADIQHAWVRESAVAPGDTAHVVVQLKPFGGAAVTRELAVRVPASAVKDSLLTVRVAGGQLAEGPIPVPANFAELLGALELRHRSNTLVAFLDQPGVGLLYGDFRTRSLPASVLHDLAPLLADRAVVVPDSVEASIDTDWVVRGQRNLWIRVR